MSPSCTRAGALFQERWRGDEEISFSRVMYGLLRVKTTADLTRALHIRIFFPIWVRHKRGAKGQWNGFTLRRPLVFNEKFPPKSFLWWRKTADGRSIFFRAGNFRKSNMQKPKLGESQTFSEDGWSWENKLRSTLLRIITINYEIKSVKIGCAWHVAHKICIIMAWSMAFTYIMNMPCTAFCSSTHGKHSPPQSRGS